jgi:c(7)-type cytochrome triheme protein
MKSKCIRFTTALAIVGASLLWLGMNLGQSAEVPVPPDFSYEDTKPLEPVPFSHKAHAAKKLGCPDCHTKPFQMKKLAASKDMTMKVLNEGQFCGNCHDGKKAFSTKEAKDCAKCHVKKK